MLQGILIYYLIIANNYLYYILIIDYYKVPKYLLLTSLLLSKLNCHLFLIES